MTFTALSSMNIAEKRIMIKTIKASIQADIIANKAAKARDAEVKKIARENKAVDRAAKKAARIAKLEAKLSALKNPVGVAARKAAKKPSNVTVLKAA